MSTSWQSFPETKTAVCCYCGFSTTYADKFPGDIEHDCDPTLHPPIVTRQSLHIGRSPRPEMLSHIPLDQLLACIHRSPELGQEPCPICIVGTRIKDLRLPDSRGLPAGQKYPRPEVVPRV